MTRNADFARFRSGGRQGALPIAVELAIAAAVVVTVGAFFGRFHWTLELLTHFRLQYVVAALILAGCAIAMRRAVSSLLAAAVVVANLAVVVPYVVPAIEPAHAASESVRLLVANVSLNNDDYRALHELIAEERPDIVGLVEVNQSWVDALADVVGDYRYRVLRPEEGPFGIALFSRIPLQETAQSPYREEGIQTAIFADIGTASWRARLSLAHLMAPTSRSRAAMRNRQLEGLADYFRDGGNDEGILIGDLNVTPWSPFYASFESDTGMINAARGRGYKGTWPAWLLPMQIPIDHCLLSPGLRVSHIRRGRDIGSDHRPLVVDVVIAGNAHRVNSAE